MEVSVGWLQEVGMVACRTNERSVRQDSVPKAQRQWPCKESDIQAL